MDSSIDPSDDMREELDNVCEGVSGLKVETFISEDLTLGEMPTSGPSSSTPVDLKEFTCFQKLPVELRLKIIGMAARKPRYIQLILGYPNPVRDEYEKELPKAYKQMQRTIPRNEYIAKATYLPPKNHASIFQIDHQTRQECLQRLNLFKYVENAPILVPYPFSVYVNFDSDILILDIGGAWVKFDPPYFLDLMFSRFTNNLPRWERENLKRLVIPAPRQIILRRCVGRLGTYFNRIRSGLPNLTELCFFNLNGGVKERGVDLATHICRYPGVLGNPTVLVDISDYWSDDHLQLFAPTFEALQRMFAEEKLKFPAWKLEKIRLVVWAKEDGGEGMDVGQVADLNGNGIYERVGDDRAYGSPLVVDGNRTAFAG